MPKSVVKKALDSAKGLMQRSEEIRKANTEERSEFTREDVTPEIYNELENEWYRNFNVMRLFVSAEEESPLMKFAVIALLIVNIIVSFIR